MPAIINCGGGASLGRAHKVFHVPKVLRYR